MQCRPLEDVIDASNESSIDINETIESAEKLIILVKPIIKLGKILDRIRRWESSVLCVLVLVLCNGTCFLVPSSYYLLVNFMVFISLAGLGYMHRRTNILAKVIPTARSRHGSGLVSQQDSQRQPVHDFQLLLVLVNSFLNRIARWISKFYSVLKWDSLELSLKCYGCTLGVVFALHVLPLRWVSTLAVDVFLLHAPIQQVWKDLSNYRQQRRVNAVATATLTPDSSEYSFSQAGGPEEEETDSSEKMEDSSSDDLHNEYGGQGSASKAKERAGVVERLKEFKRRQQQAGSGSCVSCSVNFTTILKRRHICSHCGNHFCSKCCSNKVPRSFFGATSPAAQTETVPVCVFCYSYLTAGNPCNPGSLPSNFPSNIAAHSGSKEKLT